MSSPSRARTRPQNLFLPPLWGEVGGGVRGFAARGPAGRTPAPAPPHKGEGFIRWGLGFTMLLALAACGRETRDYRSTAMNESARAAAFEGNAWHVAQGQRLFAWMNCSGCHSHGGGGMGPPLRDEEWRYGGTMEDIVATILNGRPGGMPSFRGRITEDQAWQLAAFVRTLSAQTRHDIRPARADEPANVPPMDLDRPKPMRRVSPTQDQRTVP